MPTSTAERSTDGESSARDGESPARGPREGGFTLIEISLVILIIAIVLSLAVPRLRSVSRSELSAQARRLSNTFRLLRSEAILNGQVYQLRYDLNRDRYWAVAVDPETGDVQVLRESGSLARGVSLQEPIAFGDVVLPESIGKVFEGGAWTNFYPDGSVDQTVIHIDDGYDAFTLWVDPFSGRLFLSQGYRDIDYDT
jgi:prepilin-type N-terminal cleavage/methylation domain-containing protein